MAGCDDLPQRFVPLQVDRQGNHVGAGGHDFRDFDIAQCHDAFDHFARFIFDQPLALTFGDDFANFLFQFQLGQVMRFSRHALHNTFDPFGTGIRWRQQFAADTPDGPGAGDKRFAPNPGRSDGKPDDCEPQNDNGADQFRDYDQGACKPITLITRRAQQKRRRRNDGHRRGKQAQAFSPQSRRPVLFQNFVVPRQLIAGFEPFAQFPTRKIAQRVSGDRGQTGHRQGGET